MKDSLASRFKLGFGSFAAIAIMLFNFTYTLKFKMNIYLIQGFR